MDRTKSNTQDTFWHFDGSKMVTLRTLIVYKVSYVRSKCDRGKSNPRLFRGRELCYHYTTAAASFALFRSLVSIQGPMVYGPITLATPKMIAG